MTTNEIGRNVDETSQGSGEIARNITSVAQAAQNTDSGATQTQTAAQELARMAATLQQLVNQFKYEDAAVRSEAGGKVLVGVRAGANGQTATQVQG